MKAFLILSFLLLSGCVVHNGNGNIGNGTPCEKNCGHITVWQNGETRILP